MQRHFRFRGFIFFLIVNLCLLAEAMYHSAPRQKLEPSSPSRIKALAPSSPATEEAEIRKWQMALNLELGSGKGLMDLFLNGFFEEFGINDLVVLKFEGMPLNLFKKQLKPLQVTLRVDGIRFHILPMETKEDERTKKKVLVPKGSPPEGALVVAIGGGRSIEVLRKKFSSKFLVALLDISLEDDYELRSFPILTQEKLAHFNEKMTRKHANGDRVIEFVNFLVSNGVKAIAFALDRTITAGASLGAMPPENVEGSEESWKKIKKLSKDFRNVAALLERRSIPLYITTFSDVAIKNQIMDSREREEWLQHHYGESPPDMDFSELMKKAVAGVELVLPVLEANFITPEMIVAVNPRYRPVVPKHKSYHLQEVRKDRELHRSELLLIDYDQASVLHARREGYPVLQVVGTKGFNLRNLVAPV